MPSNVATLDPSRQLKPVVYRKPGEQSKGGEYHGGPKRWNGKGPPPARHIPWPEIFKHHISVIEGHKKMCDMVRKHTVQGTGNWRTIMDMVNRADEMLRTSKQLAWSFIPPPGQRDQVPLGVSSDSMYPGYSPADHEYGKAAEEYGKAVAEAKERGVEIPKHPDIEYQIGQGKGIKRKSLAQIRELQQSGSGSDEGPPKQPKVNGDSDTKVKTKDESTRATNAQPEGENLCFVIDTNPTPMNIPNFSSSASKRDAEDGAVEGKKSKKKKINHSGDLPAATKKVDETEDISAEVDARIKAKEEKRILKEEKKRKRESEKSEVSTVEADQPANAAVVENGEKPKKKKNKVKHPEDGEEQSHQKLEKKRAGEEGGEEGEKKKRKKRRKD